jgi:glyoxylase-like metal-dependent hydrolase (beta-lactamase superfamily II)
MSTIDILTPRPYPTSQLHGAPHDIAYLTTTLVNVVFLGLPDPHGILNDWVLIDAGIPMNAGRIRAFAEERFGATPPRAILLTHGHFDHVGSLAALLRHWPEVPVYAHRLEMPYLTGHSSYPPPDPTVGGGSMARLSPLFPKHAHDFRPNVMPLPPDGVIPFLPDWRWIHTPGHTPGHVSFYREADQSLIVGDAFVTQKQESLFGALTQEYVVHGPPTYFTPDWISAKSSVQTLEQLNPRWAITGHGLPISNPRLAHHLHLLSTRFEEFALPADGRYVRQPAWADERGTVWVPPAPPNPGPKIIAGLALGVIGLAVVRATMKHERKQMW